jgi:dTDP-4-amino-4,6-dideoxygalactose transaminase
VSRGGSIPLVDLGAQYAAIKEEIDEAVARVLRSSRFVLGPEVAAFEEEFAAYCGVAHAVGVSSGSSALWLGLRAAGIGPGDEVITTPLTFAATAEAILQVGATIRFADVDPGTGNIDPRRIQEALTPRTRAIVPVHLYGQPAEMDAICQLAAKREIAVLEDAAQAHGARYDGAPVGGIGRVGSFSFFPSKNLGAYGDGGMVVTNDASLADTVRLLRNHGKRAKHDHVVPGFGERLDELQAAVLRVKLRHLDDWNGARRRHAASYDAALRGTQLRLPSVHPKAQSAFHLYVVRVRERDRVRTQLEQCGVASGLHYPLPLHLQPAFRAAGYGPGDLPEAEAFAAECLSLPMYPELSPAQIDRITHALSDAIAR